MVIEMDPSTDTEDILFSFFVHKLHLSMFFFQKLNSTRLNNSQVLAFHTYRILGKGHSNDENHEVEEAMMDDFMVESDDERPESFDDKVRQKEMRKGIDLATTLERIEKNFVITDPRLPDNPIVMTRF